MGGTDVPRPAENRDGELERQQRWFAENERRASEAMTVAGIWYGPRPPQVAHRPVTCIERVLEAAAGVTSIGRAHIMDGRQAHVTAARHVVFFILRNHCSLSVAHIARSFGCHHGVVVNGCSRIAADRDDFDSWIAPVLAKIEAGQP